MNDSVSRLLRLLNPLLAVLVLALTTNRAMAGDAIARDVLTIFLGLSLFTAVTITLTSLVGLPLPRKDK